MPSRSPMAVSRLRQKAIQAAFCEFDGQVVAGPYQVVPVRSPNSSPKSLPRIEPYSDLSFRMTWLRKSSVGSAKPEYPASMWLMGYCALGILSAARSAGGYQSTAGWPGPTPTDTAVG